MPPKSDRFLKPRGVCLAKVTDGGWPSVKHGTAGFKGLRLTAGRWSKQGHVGPMFASLGPIAALCSPMLAVCCLRSALC